MAHISGNTTINLPTGKVKLNFFGYALEPKGHSVESLHDYVKTDIKPIGIGLESKQLTLKIMKGPRTGNEVKLVHSGLHFLNNRGHIGSPKIGDFLPTFYYVDGQRYETDALVVAISDVVCEQYGYQLDSQIPFAFGIGFNPVFVYGQFPKESA